MSGTSPISLIPGQSQTSMLLKSTPSWNTPPELIVLAVVLYTVFTYVGQLQLAYRKLSFSGKVEMFVNNTVDPRFNGLMRREPCPLV